MSDNEKDTILSVSAPYEAFLGTARAAAIRFPHVANVAATVGLASLGIDHVQVRLVADPNARMKTHEITADSTVSRMQITMHNEFATGSHTTSAITAYAVIRLIADLRAHTIIA